jgi:hypothetical protein
MNYQEKYLKYKNKYLQLKNIQLGGASFPSSAASGGSGTPPSSIDVNNFLKDDLVLLNPNGAVYEIKRTDNGRERTELDFIHPVNTLLVTLENSKLDGINIIIKNKFLKILRKYIKLDKKTLIQQVLYYYIIFKILNSDKQYIFSNFIHYMLISPNVEFYINVDYTEAKDIIIDELEIISDNGFISAALGGTMPNLNLIYDDIFKNNPAIIQQTAAEILEKIKNNNLSDFNNYTF